MATALSLAFDILARDRASGPLEKVGNTADKTGGKLAGMGSKMAGAAKVAAASVAVAGTALTGVALKSASTFKSVGGEVLKLQRYTGATAEEASRLRFAAKQSGLDVDIMTKSLGLLSKNLAGTKLDKLKLGLKDAHGKALPLNESLLKIADRFEKMPNGAEKTALAMQIFGKSGAQMLPFLSKGAEGIAELEKQSDKFGNTLSSGDLDSVKAATKNQRLFSSAMQGLQIQIGRYVLPIMTKFTAFMAENMPTAIAFVRKGMETLAPVFQDVSNFIDMAVENFRMFFNALTTGFTEDEGTPIEMLAVTIRDTLLPVLQKVGGFIKDNLKPILFAMGAAFVAVTAPVTGIVAGLVLAYTHFQGVRDAVARVVEFFQSTVVPAFAAVADTVSAKFAEFRGWVDQHWSAIQESVGHVIVAVKAIIDGFVAAVGAAWRMWGDNIMSVVQAVFGNIQQIIESAVKIVAGIIETAMNLINGDWGKAWDSFKGVLGAAWDAVYSTIKGAVTVIVSLVSGIGEAVGRAASGLFDGIKSAFKSAINWIIERWNGLEFKVPKIDPPGPGPTFGGFTIGVPDIKTLHTGGRITSMGIEPLRSDEVFAKLQVGETVYPKGSAPAAAGDLHLHVNQYPGEDTIGAGMRALRHHQNVQLAVAVR